MKKYACHCGKLYSQKRSLRRHQRTANCNPVIGKYKALLESGNLTGVLMLLQERDSTIQQLQEQVRDMKGELDEKNRAIAKLINNTNKPTVGTINNTNTDNSIHITTGQIKKLLTQYSTGPPLEKITDMSRVFNEDDDLFLEDIAYDHRQKILHKTLGDSLVAIYKTPDPKNQSVWNTDSSRLNYLIKHAIGRKKAGWMMDKKGVLVVTNIIAPVLDYLREKMNSYTPNMEIPKTFTVKGDLLAITKEINDGTLAERINKHIAGHFYMTEHARQLITYKDE